jgi:hypothetical protein
MDRTPARAVPRLSSLGLFLALAGVAITVLQLGHTLFPGDRGLALAGRTLCALAATGVLIAGSRWLLKRDGQAPDRLALGIDARHAGAFGVGAGMAVLHILLLLAALFVVVPFKVGAGPLPFTAVAAAAAGYLTGNFVEELLFRGYLLIVLAHWFGTTQALWLPAHRDRGSGTTSPVSMRWRWARCCSPPGPCTSFMPTPGWPPARWRRPSRCMPWATRCCTKWWARASRRH